MSSVGSKKSGADGWKQTGVDSMGRPVYSKDSHPAGKRSEASLGHVKSDFPSSESAQSIPIGEHVARTKLADIDFSGYTSDDPYVEEGDARTPSFSLYTEDDDPSVVTAVMTIEDNPQAGIVDVVYEDIGCVAPDSIESEEADFPDDLYEAYDKAWERLAESQGNGMDTVPLESNYQTYEVYREFDLNDPAYKDTTVQGAWRSFGTERDNAYHMTDPDFKEYFLDELEERGYDTSDLESLRGSFELERS